MPIDDSEGDNSPDARHRHRGRHHRSTRSHSGTREDSRSRERRSRSRSTGTSESPPTSTSTPETPANPRLDIQDEGIPITAPANYFRTRDRTEEHRHHHHHHHSHRESSRDDSGAHRPHSENQHRKTNDSSTHRPLLSRPAGQSASGPDVLQRLLTWRPFASLSDDKPTRRREKIIGVFAVLTLLTPALFFSAATLLAQLCTLGLAATAFLFLFLPVFDGGKSLPARYSLKILLRFPLFWLGLLLLALMACQGWNPAWNAVVRTYTMRLLPIAHIHWLPSGVDSPFDMSRSPGGMNAFRQMIIFGTPWLLLCALWAGVHRRKAIAGIAWGVLCVGFALAAWGVQMRISGVQRLGRYTMQDTSFFASFLYQNHAAAWLSLLFGIALALVFWHWGKSATVKASGGPHLLSAGIALCLACSAICTLSFGGIFTLGVLLFVAAPIGVLWTLFRKGVNRNALIGGAAASALLALFALVFFETTDLHEAEAKLSRKFNLVQNAQIDDRVLLRRATWNMVEYRDHKNLWSGWGAGSYRWVSPHFFKKIPEFRHKDGSFERANYAHCDWLQMLTEWGVAGAVLVVAAFLWMAAWLLLRIRRWTPATFSLLFALLLFMGHATMDFLNYSMPILCLVAFTAVAAARLILPRSKTAAKQY